MPSLTDEQLDMLNNDIESGLVMIVDKKHYYQLIERTKELEGALKQILVIRRSLSTSTTKSESEQMAECAEKVLKGE